MRIPDSQKGRGSLGKVTTVLGEVEGSALGVTLPHEHVFINFIEERSVLFNDYTTMLQELRQYKASGGGTLVELTARDSTPGAVWDPGGSVRAASGKSGGPLAASAAEALRDVSRESGVHIVAGTGFYRDPFIDREWFDRHSVDEIAELLVRDITEGLDGTDVRAGIIGEIGAHKWYVSAAEERSYRAAARAHNRTGLTISTHATPWPTGLLQLDILESEGVDPRRVVIGGCDKINLSEYHDAVLARGAWVEFDTIRGGNDREVDLRLHYVCRMVEAGHLERILVSNDIAKAEFLKCNGGTGYEYVPTTFADLLRDRGLSGDQLRCLLVDNPRRMLTGE